jgi:hypothetical protein
MTGWLGMGWARGHTDLSTDNQVGTLLGGAAGQSLALGAQVQPASGCGEAQEPEIPQHGTP